MEDIKQRCAMMYNYFAENEEFGEKFACDVLMYALAAKQENGELTYEEASDIWVSITAPAIKK